MDKKTTQKPDVVGIATSQRHMLLLRKVKSGKGLTQKEIAELAKHEKQKNKGKAKDKKVVKEQPLNPKQEAFCHEFVIDRNGTRAYKKVYKCSVKAAEAGASRLLRNVKVQARVKELESKVFKTADITAERVIQEIGKIAFSNIGDFVDITNDGGSVSMKFLKNLTTEQMSCISEITEFETVSGLKRFKFKLHDKLKALELLGKTNTLKMFIENLNVKLPEGCGVLVAPGVGGKNAWAGLAKEQQKNSQKQGHE
ncbi:MAG: hypothetical protein DRP56_08820 [Planctomycetota bacterium]|nr:MAG: hypothetical protein DRP56_08820 [Planctomycetota bacterium]